MCVFTLIINGPFFILFPPPPPHGSKNYLSKVTKSFSTKNDEDEENNRFSCVEWQRKEGTKKQRRTCVSTFEEQAMDRHIPNMSVCDKDFFHVRMFTEAFLSNELEVAQIRIDHRAV